MIMKINGTRIIRVIMVMQIIAERDFGSFLFNHKYNGRERNANMNAEIKGIKKSFAMKNETIIKIRITAVGRCLLRKSFFIFI